MPTGRHLGVGHGDRCRTRTEARTGARLARGAGRCRAPVRDPDLGRNADFAEPCGGDGSCNAQSDRSFSQRRGRGPAGELDRKPGRVFQRRPAAPVRGWVVAVRARRCSGGAQDGAARANGPDRARVARRGDRRGAARNGPQSDERFGGVGIAGRLGRSIRARLGAWPQFGLRFDPKPRDRRACAAGDASAPRGCRPCARLFRDRPHG